MNKLGEYLSEHAADVLCVVVVLAGLFVGGFGAANWSDHFAPPAPQRAAGDTDATYAQRLELHNRKLDSLGQNAVVPFVYAVPLTIFGFGTAVVGCALLIARGTEADVRRPRRHVRRLREAPRRRRRVRCDGRRT